MFDVPVLLLASTSIAMIVSRSERVKYSVEM